MSSFRQLMMRKKGGGSLNPLITIVGSPTITDDFIYKNAGADDYIYINEILPLSTANSWKIKCKIKYNNNPLNTVEVCPLIAYYGNNSNDGKSPVLRTDYYSGYLIRCLISRVGYSNWNINVNTGNFYFQVGQEYYIEYGFTGSQYYVKDLLTNNTLWSKNDTNKCECSNYIALFHNGYNDRGPEVCGGEMDLKTLEVEINGSVYFKGVI